MLGLATGLGVGTLVGGVLAGVSWALRQMDEEAW